MRSPLLAGLLLLMLQNTILAQTADEMSRIWESDHVTKVLPSNLRHAGLKRYLEGLKEQGVTVAEVGRSFEGREIYQVEFGKGPLRVFMWSQMHGDEPTATSALVDMFAILQKNRDKEWVKNIEKAMTVRAVPMLNPDGAEVYKRRNKQDVDINRDAVNLRTPEAQLLKRLRDEWQPEIGFNLHNQNALTAAGRSNKQAAISLLVVYGDAAKTTNGGHERNRRLASKIVSALQPFIPGHIGKYDDEFTATAFGDNFSAWGTPVILIETGALHGKDEMFLVKMNFIAFLTALTTIADQSERTAATAAYDSLPPNTSGVLMNVIFRNATIVDAAGKPRNAPADIGIVTERRRAEFAAPTFVRNIGGLTGVFGLEEYDAGNFFVAGRYHPVKVGGFGELIFYRKDRKIDWTAPNLESRFPPDAVFSLGKWIKGGDVVPRR